MDLFLVHTFSLTLIDDMEIIKPFIAIVNIGELMFGTDTLSIRQLIKHLGPSTLKKCKKLVGILLNPQYLASLTMILCWQLLEMLLPQIFQI